MNRIAGIFLLGFILAFAGCDGGQEGIRVTGKLKNQIADEMVLLERYVPGGTEAVDTVEVDASGAFEFFVKQDEPTFYRVNFYNRQVVNMILDGTEEEVKLKLNGTDPQGTFEVEGSRHTSYLIELEGLINDHKQDVQDLNQEAIQARMDGNQQRLEDLTEDYYALMNESQKNIKSYIWKITPSLAAFYGLQALSPEEQFSFYDSVATRFEAELPDNQFTKTLVEQVGGLRSVAIGSDAPEISLPNPDGEIITLSSLKGNYVLIDFWAAWCRPCRVENPNVVRVYNKYSHKNFEILGVSLDRTKEAWVGAIKQDGLPWKHVSDLKYFNSEAANDYNISAIPATYLISPEGKIIAKGLRGAALEAKLKEIFG